MKEIRLLRKIAREGESFKSEWKLQNENGSNGHADDGIKATQK